MRKDVECTFGILKQRWIILKSGIRIHSVDIADEIFKTCCALHNFLLDANGLDIPWEDSTPCDYAEDAFEAYMASEIPDAIHELHREHGALN